MLVSMCAACEAANRDDVDQ